jgi:hypothetical protein
MIDEDSINNGTPPNFFTAQDVNDDIARLGLRDQLRFFKNNVGQRIVLRTGRWWDEGWFALETVPASWARGGPSSNGLENYVGVMQPNGTILVGDGLGRGKYPASKLHIVPGVTPLRAAGLQDLVGQQVCAVVYDNDIKYNYWYGSLNGANLGRVAFKVISVNAVSGASCLSLPQVEIEILDADIVCGGKLYNDAPEGPGEVCLAEDGVVLPLTGSGLVATGTFDNCSDGKCLSSVTLEIDAEVGQTQCPAGTEFVSFVPDEFFGITTVFDPSTEDPEDLVIREKCTTTDGLLYNCVPATEVEIPTCGPTGCVPPEMLRGVLQDYGLEGQYFYDTQTGYYWYDPAHFAGHSLETINDFLYANPNWHWATSAMIDDLVGKYSAGGVPLTDVMGPHQFQTGILVNGTWYNGSRWIGYYANSPAQPDGWLVQTYLEDGPPVCNSPSTLGESGFQGNVIGWGPGAWLYSTVDPESTVYPNPDM